LIPAAIAAIGGSNDSSSSDGGRNGDGTLLGNSDSDGSDGGGGFGLLVPTGNTHGHIP
jgi:hypothetical protein